MLKRIIDWIDLNLLWKSPERALWLYKSVPNPILQTLRLANLKNVLRHVREHSIFYSRLFEKYPYYLETLTSPEDLGQIFTTPKDLQKTPMKHFLCGKPNTAFETTGTISKTPKRVLFSTREIEDAGRVGAAGLWNLGIRPEDRIASSFDYSFWVSGPTLKASLTEIGAFHVEAGRISPEEFYDRIRPYGCNVIVADPGWLVALSEVAEKKGPWLMKLMIIGGENLTENAREYIESVWQCPVLLSYGQTEAFGMVGMECSEKNGYHVNDMDLWFEIVNADESGYGELVYTTLRRRTMPLIRYKSGDVTKIISDPCNCGNRSIRLAKLRGRVDEMAVTGVGNIAFWMMNSVIEGLNPAVQEWQLGVKRGASKDHLEVRIENANGVSKEKIRDEILEGMKTKMQVAYQGISQGLAELDVKLYKPGQLKGNHRKLKRISDERQF